MTNHVLINNDGAVFIEGHAAGLVRERDDGPVTVFILIDGHCEPVAHFRNYKPDETARSWTRFILSLKTPRQVLSLVKKEHPVLVAEKLGWKSPAIRDAETVQPHRNPRTGSPPKR